MKRCLIAVVVASVALLCVAEVKAQYPYRRYGSYSGMHLNLGGGNSYNFGSTPYGSYSGMKLNLGGGSYYNFGSTPYGSYNGMSLNLGWGNRYNSRSLVPYGGYGGYGGYRGYGGFGPGY